MNNKHSTRLIVVLVVLNQDDGGNVKLTDRGDLTDFKAFLARNGVDVDSHCGLNPVLLKVDA